VVPTAVSSSINIKSTMMIDHEHGRGRDRDR